MNSSIYWIVVPYSEMREWMDSGFKSLLSDFTLSQRRVVKDVEVANERSRHSITCTAIENGFYSMSYIANCFDTLDNVKKVVDARVYNELIGFIMKRYRKRATNCFVGSSFLHHDYIQLQLDLLQQFARECEHEISDDKLLDILNSRIKCLREIQSKNVHLIDIPLLLKEAQEDEKSRLKDFFVERLLKAQSRKSRSANLSFVSKKKREKERLRLRDFFTELGNFHFDPFEQDKFSQILTKDVCTISSEENEEITDNRGKDALTVAKKSVEDYLKKNNPNSSDAVNLSDYNDWQITEILHSFVFSQNTLSKESMLPIIYSDGSQAKSFPINCLKAVNDNVGYVGREMHIGMMTNRHDEMDEIISMYWFLNMEVSGRGQTAAEIDDFCYRLSKEMFKSIREQGEDLKIHFYQAGFPFAVIGFYRALTEALLEQKSGGALAAKVSVVPMYYRGKNNPYEKGKTWQ